VIDVRDLAFSYANDVSLFGNLSWSATRGCSWSVVGASGAGKTTLLFLLAGLLKPTQGSVSILGVPLQRPRPRTGLILQNLGLMPWSTVEKNIRLGLRIRRFYGPDGKHVPKDWKLDRADMDRTTDQWLDRLGLGDLRKRFPAELSGGERQRVAIARTMVLDPDLLLMDEPFSSLDAHTREDLQRLMLRLELETGHTRILVTHDVPEAVVLGRRILVLGRGGLPRGIVDNPAYGDADRNPGATERISNAIRELLA